MTKPKSDARQIAIIGAGMAGIAAARTLLKAGHHVKVFEKSPGLGGRMATRSSPFGTFDHGTQYFTVRDARFAMALETVPGLCRPWSANTVRVLDELGRVAAAGLPAREPHWVPNPDMNALARPWAQPLASAHRIDAVLLAIPATQARELLQNSDIQEQMALRIDDVQVAPCWTLMLAFPQAMQPGMSALGPQWNAARSTHHRIAWLARESSKPGREPIERWTVQRVQAKLLKAFSEVTGIRAEPAHAVAHRWVYAQTIRPLGKSHLWDAKTGIGVCGDWCLGHRVEDAFISGLELALAAL